MSMRAGPDPGRTLAAFALRHLRVVTRLCSHQMRRAGYNLERRTCQDWNLIYVTSGAVVWVIDGVEHPLGPGDLALVPPGVWHHAYSRSRAVELGSIHVLVTLPGGQDLFQVLVPPRRQSFAPGSRFDGYFRGAIAEFARGDQAAQSWMPPWAELVVRELIRHDAESGLLTNTGFDPVVAGVLDELRARLGRPTTLGKLAQVSGWSPQHLNRTFRRALGLTPLQCLAQLRLEQAGAMLRDGRLTVRAIAAAVGCVDPAYFSRWFRAQTGASPVDYRDAASGS